MNNQNFSSSLLLEFGNKLLNQLLLEVKSDESIKNLFISPLSLHFALGLTMKGAQGDTQREMINLFGFPAEQLADFFQYSEDLFKDLSTSLNGIQLLNAMALWVNQRFPLKGDFITWAQGAYQAQVQNRDFSNPAVIREINHWVQEATQQHINSVIERLSPAAAAVILNAIFFKGTWQTAFDPKSTRPAPFYLINGKAIDVPMMSQKGKYNYFKDGEVEMLLLPYQGENASFIIVLPDKQIRLDLSKIQSLQQKLSKLDLIEQLTKSKKVEVSITLPRLNIECSLELTKALQSLGVKSAFIESLADFSKMCNVPPKVYISEILHKTTLDVNEEGTEASAATKITMMSKAITKTIRFIVDRPFYCAIVGHQGKLLFHGWVFNPQSA